MAPSSVVRFCTLAYRHQSWRLCQAAGTIESLTQPATCETNAGPHQKGERCMRDPTSQLESLIENLFTGGQLELCDNVMWHLRDGYLAASLRVQQPDHQQDLRLELRKNPRITKFSIQFLINSKPARRYCSDHPHTNPPDCVESPNVLFPKEHKHRWSDLTGDECVYVPDDFNTHPIEDAFYSFCEECGITFHGLWNDPPEVQLGFETVA